MESEIKDEEETAQIKQEEGAQIKEDVKIQMKEEGIQIKEAEEARFKEDDEETDTITPLFRIPLDTREQPEHGISDDKTSSLPIVIAPMDSTGMPEERDSELCEPLSVNPISSSGNSNVQQKEPAICEVIVQNLINPHAIRTITFVDQSQAGNAANSSSQRQVPWLEKFENAFKHANTCTVQPCTRDSFPSQHDYLKHCIDVHGVRTEILNSCESAQTCTVQPCTRDSFPSLQDYVKHCIDVHGVRKEVLKTQNFSDLRRGIRVVCPPVERDEGKGSKKCTVQPCTRESFPSQYDYVNHCVEVHGVNREILKTQIAWVPPGPNHNSTKNKKLGSSQQNQKCQECRDIYLPIITDPTKHPPDNFFVHRHKDGVYKCPFCTHRTSSVSNQPWHLLWHVVSAHTVRTFRNTNQYIHKDGPNSVCPDCTSIYMPLITTPNIDPSKWMSSMYHTHRHTTGVYKCPFCLPNRRESFIEPRYLLDHIKHRHRPTKGKTKGFVDETHAQSVCSECRNIYVGLLSAVSRDPSKDITSKYHTHRHKNGNYSCPFCLQSKSPIFSQPKYLLAHIGSNHVPSKHVPIPSIIENITQTTSTFNSGELGDQSIEEKCQECKDIYLSIVSDPTKHPRYDGNSGFHVHRHENDVYWCPFCVESESLRFSEPWDLLGHIEVAHAQHKEKPTEPSVRPNIIDKARTPSACSECRKIFEPMLSDPGYDPSKYKSSNYRNHRHTTNIYTCPFCPESKTPVVTYKKHILDHVKTFHAATNKTKSITVNDAINAPECPRNCSRDSFRSNFEHMIHCSNVHGIRLDVLRPVMHNTRPCSDCEKIYFPLLLDREKDPSRDKQSKYHTHGHESGLYTCPMCPIKKSSVFSKPQDLLRHVKATHAKVPKVTVKKGSSLPDKSETLVHPADITMLKTEQAESKVSLLKTRNPNDLANIPSSGNNEQTHIKMESVELDDKGDDNVGSHREDKINGWVLPDPKPCPMLPKRCNRNAFSSSIEWMIHCKHHHQNVFKCDFCFTVFDLLVGKPAQNVSQLYPEYDSHTHKPAIYICPLCPPSSNLFFQQFGYLKRHVYMTHVLNKSPPPEPQVQKQSATTWTQPSSLLHGHNVEVVETGGKNSNIHAPVGEYAKSQLVGNAQIIPVKIVLPNELNSKTKAPVGEYAKRKLVGDAETIPVKITRILPPKNAGTETVLPKTWTQPSSLLSRHNVEDVPAKEKNVKIVMPKKWTQASSLLRCLAVEAESDPAGEKTVKIVSSSELNLNTQAPVGEYAKRQLVGDAETIPIKITQIPQLKTTDVKKAQSQSLTVERNELLSANTTIGEELVKRKEIADADGNTATTVMPPSKKQKTQPKNTDVGQVQSQIRMKDGNKIFSSFCYMCPKCSNIFKTLSALKSHHKLCHSANILLYK